MAIQIRQNQQEVVVVAPSDGARRIAQYLHVKFPPSANRPNMHHCRNVYEAAARILKLLGQGRTVRAYVLVDYLPAPEMRFFGCFNGADSIRTVALSAARRQNKLDQALSLGADETIILDPRLELKSPQSDGAIKLPVKLKDIPETTLNSIEKEKKPAPEIASGPPAAMPSAAPPTPPTPVNQAARPQDQTPPIPINQDAQVKSHDPPMRREPPIRKPPAPAAPAEPVLTDEELDALLS